RAAAEARAFGWHLSNLGASVETGNRFATDFHLRAVQGAEPPGVTARLVRAGLHAQLGDWPAAAEDYTRSLSENPLDDPCTLHQQAVLRLRMGDEAVYRRACGLLRERCRSGAQPSLVAEALRALVLTPAAPAEAESLPALAGALRHDWPDCPGIDYLEALACYRAGRLADAARLGETAAQRERG